MEKKPKAKYKIAETFKLTGQGLVFTGEIVEGEIGSGDFLAFISSGDIKFRKIKGISTIRRIDRNPNFISLLIAGEGQNEIDELKGYMNLNQVALVYETV